MSLLLLDELLSRCDILQSFATSGRYDDYLIDKFSLSRIMKLGPLKSFYLKMYDYPFARKLFVREIRYILLDILQHYRNHFLRTAKTDLTAEKAIKNIDEYLEKLPKNEAKKNYLKRIIPYVLPFITSISISQINQTYDIIHQYFPVILLIGIFSILPVAMILFNKIFEYVFQKHWFSICLKKQRIQELKNKIIQE